MTTGGGQPTTGSRHARLPVDRLRNHPANPRLELGDLRELAASIREHGLQQPILVQPAGGGFFEIVDGHRRYAATVTLGRRTIETLVVPRRTVAEVVITMLVTGTQARPLSTAEQRRAVCQLVDQEDMSPAQIAEQAGVSVATVYGWMKGWQPAVLATALVSAPRPLRRVTKSGLPDRRGGNRTSVGIRRVRELTDRWETRIRDVAGPVDAPDARVPLELVHELLGELRDLTQPPRGDVR